MNLIYLLSCENDHHHHHHQPYTIFSMIIINNEKKKKRNEYHILIDVIRNKLELKWKKKKWTKREPKKPIDVIRCHSWPSHSPSIHIEWIAFTLLAIIIITNYILPLYLLNNKKKNQKKTKINTKKFLYVCIQWSISSNWFNDWMMTKNKLIIYFYPTKKVGISLL